MDRWKKAYEDWGFSELDHRWEKFLVYGATAAFWMHLATWLLTRETLIPSVDDLGGWLALALMAMPGNIRAAFLIALGPPRRGEWTTTPLSPRTNPLNQDQRYRRQAIRPQAPSKRRSPAGTIGKILIGLTLFTVCAGYGITGGTIVEPSDSTTSPPRLRNQAEKRHMLELINEARVSNGVAPVTMGTNNVAQIQADQLLEDCVISHWGTNGLKPYMRYSLADGYQTNGENVLTFNECGLKDTWLQWNDEPVEMVAQAMEGLMESPGHRKTMLDSSYSKVNVGLAWDRNTFKAVQHFEGNFVTLILLPTIQDRELSMSGHLNSGHKFHGRHPLTALIVYDQEPRNLAKEHLAQTSCYSHGEIIAVLIPPSPLLKDKFQYTKTVERPQCVDPYTVKESTTPVQSRKEMTRLWEKTKERSETVRETEISLKVRKARELTAEEDVFTLRADMRALLEEHGPGVYTVMLLANLGESSKPEDQTMVISEYSVFHKSRPPRIYSLE